MKFLIVGSEGQLGKALQKKLFSLSIPFYNFSRKGLNIEDSSQIHSLLSDLEFDLIINCAAYTSVDEAERNHRAAFQANEIGPKNLAVFCNNQSKKLIHISTDFVFDGSKNTPYVPQDETNPINVYGASKLAGEQHILDCCPEHLIIRTSWVFGGHGSNFFNTICRLAKSERNISIIDDQVGTPTYINDLANAVIFSGKRLISSEDSILESIYGTYHYGGSKECSWFEFAEHILSKGKSLKKLPSNHTLHKIQSSDFKALANRPKYSALDSSNFCNLFSLKPSNWEKGVDELFLSQTSEIC